MICWCTFSVWTLRTDATGHIPVFVSIIAWSPLQFLISDSPFIAFHWSVWLQPARCCLILRRKNGRFFKNVFVVKSEALVVDERAAPEERKPSALPNRRESGREASRQKWFMPLSSWQNLFLFIETFIKLSMKRKQFLQRGRKNADEKPVCLRGRRTEWDEIARTGRTKY